MPSATKCFSQVSSVFATALVGRRHLLLVPVPSPARVAARTQSPRQDAGFLPSIRGPPDEVHLRQIPAYRDHVPARRSDVASIRSSTRDESSTLDPVEQIDAGIARLRAEVAAQLLERLRAASPDFLEQAVLDVLVAMGYGGVEQRARRIGGSGDGGVDGVIDQDPLGLARIYVQAKRYAAENSVGRPQVQGFVGALHGHQANQGVFITTSSFSREAIDYARSVNASVILVDGERFASLMIDRGVGVQAVQTFTIVKLDEDYFE
jgi:restriction system protein